MPIVVQISKLEMTWGFEGPKARIITKNSTLKIANQGLNNRVSTEIQKDGVISETKPPSRPSYLRTPSYSQSELYSYIIT